MLNTAKSKAERLVQCLGDALYQAVVFAEW